MLSEISLRGDDFCNPGQRPSTGCTGQGAAPEPPKHAGEWTLPTRLSAVNSTPQHRDWQSQLSRQWGVRSFHPQGLAGRQSPSLTTDRRVRTQSKTPVLNPMGAHFSQ